MGADRRKKEQEEFARRKAEEAQQQAAFSKTQQEEAAKLAERRKTFDNQRYHREGSATMRANQGGGYQVPYSSTASTAAPISPSRSFTTPSPDLVMGLNRASQKSQGNLGKQEAQSFPGCIDEDAEPFQSPVQQMSGKKKQVQHDDVESTGFDAADEKLMKEILEDFD
jgi:hypothetical protein